MREFVVASRCSEPLPASIASHLAMPEVSGSLFRAVRRRQEELHGGHTRLAFRFLEEPRRPHCGHFFDGLAVSEGRLVSDEAALEEVGRPRDFVESARGVFGLVYSEEDRVSIFSDPLSVYPIWTWQDDDLIVVSNNTHLIRTTLELMGIPVEKEPYCFAWQLIFNNGVDDLTGYRNIRWAPFGHYVCIEQDAGGVRPRINSLQISEPNSLFLADLPTSSLIDRAAAEISDNVAALCSGGFRHRVCDLTGGRDSRMMLAAAMQRGLAEQFVFSTGGSTQTADGNVAASIRRGLSLRRGVIVARPRRPQPDMLATLRRMLLRTYGCFAQNTATGLGRKSDRSVLHLNGGFGETFRSFYLEQLSPRAPTPLALLIRQVRARGQVLRPEAIDRMTATLEALFEARRARGFDDFDAGDQHYIEHRNRQFMGTQCRVRLNFEAAAFPLYSPAAVMAAFSMPAEERKQAKIPFELIDRLFPELLQFPLAEGRWSSSVVERHEMAERLQALEPVTPSSPSLTAEDQEEIVEVTVASCPIDDQGTSLGQTPTDWSRRMAADGKHWTWVRFDSAHALFRELVGDQDLIGAIDDVFDPDALRDLARRDLASFTGSTEIRLIYRLLAAMLWLGDREIETPLEA